MRSVFCVAPRMVLGVVFGVVTAFGLLTSPVYPPTAWADEKPAPKPETPHYEDCKGYKSCELHQYNKGAKVRADKMIVYEIDEATGKNKRDKPDFTSRSPIEFKKAERDFTIFPKLFDKAQAHLDKQLKSDTFQFYRYSCDPGCLCRDLKKIGQSSEEPVDTPLSVNLEENVNRGLTYVVKLDGKLYRVIFTGQVTGTYSVWQGTCKRPLAVDEAISYLAPDGSQALVGLGNLASAVTLVSVATFTDEPTGQTAHVSLACPQDTAAGDHVTCSLMSDNPTVADPSQFHVTLTSTRIFSDDEEPVIETSTAQPVADTTGMPKVDLEIPYNTGQTMVALLDAEGMAVGETELPVDPEPSNGADPPHGIDLPTEAVVGNVLTFIGDFTAGLNQTAVAVGGQPAHIIAQSPRSMVTSNPATTTGPTDIAVSCGAQSTHGTVTMATASAISPNTATQNGTTAQAQAQATCQAAIETYQAGLRGWVDEGWQPPKPPAKGEYVAELTYSLNTDQSIDQVKVVKSSGVGAIDAAAVARVKQLQGQFDPFPTCYTESRMEITHTFKVVYR
ncbi:MAG: hypothetical protein KC474_06225 [Cyanobacteria bacterium HKST-UBA04]|nr:hypothetical protein [Cyanobacteria bacterium HKST-UBA04]